MPDPLDPKVLLAGGGAVLGAAAAKDAFYDDSTDPDINEDAFFDVDDMGGSGVADVTDVGGDDFSDSYSDYMADQANAEMTSEMMETMHETNMEIIDNMDGSDDYYYEDSPYDSW